MADATIGDIPDGGAPTADDAEFSLDELAAINEIGGLITSTLHIDEAYEAFASRLMALVDFKRLVISTLDLERKQLLTRYVTGTKIDGFEVGTTHPYRGRPSEGNMAATRRVRLAPRPGCVAGIPNGAGSSDAASAFSRPAGRRPPQPIPDRSPSDFTRTGRPTQSQINQTHRIQDYFDSL